MDAKRTPPPPPNPNPSVIGSGAAADGGGFGRGEAAAATKHMLAFHFLRALSRIHRATPVTRRTRTIRRAAYSSMARAASPRRAWSRALLGQARARRSRTLMRRAAVLVRRRVIAAPAPSPASAAAAAARGVRIIAAGETSAAARAVPPPPRQQGEPPRADALRRLVPGGAGMEYSSLLEETADYLRSLRAQVQLMQGLVDLFSYQ
ncbi:transcription factor IBH1 [Oryza glaberrima]|uniref:IBH1-like N-terminal domain-containing protein n=1 Tax=Oryza glaberrima TaxID=4538 RepID=I1PQI3_ORYGL|nr:transcription factor IBH1 [Oryza glaberrima]